MTQEKIDQAAPISTDDTFVSAEMLGWVFVRMNASIAKMLEQHANHDVVFGAAEAVSSMQDMIRLIPVIRRADLAAPSAPAEVEGLVERLSNAGHGGSIVPNPRLCREAATALTELQARAEKTDAERDELLTHITKLEAYALDMDRRLMRKGNPKWIPLHTEEIIQDIAEFENAKLKGGGV